MLTGGTVSARGAMGMRSATTIVVTAFVMLAAACGRDEPTALPDPAETGPPVEIPGSTTPSIDPEAETGFTAGTAAVSISGALNLSETYPSLGLPALWVPPPGDLAMRWRGPGRELTLTGVSFTAQQSTSPERVLAFAVRGADGPIAFVSEDGECLVSISPALPDQMGGTFLCTAITGAGDDGSTVTVSAQGSFAAE
jgi:hypothetical protein